MANISERLAALIRGSYPYAFCYPCLAAKLTETETEIRNAAQLVMIQSAGFVSTRRVCKTCGSAGDLLTFHIRRD
jgi:hypothetical protein